MISLVLVGWVVLAVALGMLWARQLVTKNATFRLTGIPYTEQQALRSRGNRYREYQRSTSVFIPWFRRKSA